MITLTVSQINRYVKSVLEEDKKLSEVFVRGEISNLNLHRQSGHCYMTLKDQSSALRAVMFNKSVSTLRFRPESGMSVIARGTVGVFERDGTYQLYITDMQPDGGGVLAIALEQQKEILKREGLFNESHKKPLPRYPRRVGIITSSDGAALADILSILERRYPLCIAVVCPATVQGSSAPESLRRALETIEQKGDCDVVIIGRGGGSAEDLWAFNDSQLAYAIHRCDIPIVSAVGHETDFTICDLVADKRAPTPTAAAQMVCPNIDDLEQRLYSIRHYFKSQAFGLLYRQERRANAIKNHRALSHPIAYVKKNQERLDFYRNRLHNKSHTLQKSHELRLANLSGLLDSLSPLKTLGRGYAIPYKDNSPVRCTCQLKKGDNLKLRLLDGLIYTTINSIETKGAE